MIRNVEYIPERVIEQRSLQILIAFQERFGIIAGPPIPIDKIIEKHLDLRFDWDDIDDTPEERILGYLDPATRRICMNARWQSEFDEFTGSEAFTKAHEVGHWDMHVFQGGEMQLAFPLFAPATPGKYLCRQSTRDPREFQANRFASYLLMPHDMLIAAIKGISVINWLNIRELGKVFGVSATAMKIRLEGLKLIYAAPDGKIYRSEGEYSIHRMGSSL